MKKKILGMLTVFTLIFTGMFGFVGCGNKKAETPAEEPTAEITEDQMLAKLQNVLRTRAEFDGTYEMTNTMTMTPTQTTLTMFDELESQIETLTAQRDQLQAQLIEEQGKAEPDANVIEQISAVIGEINTGITTLNGAALGFGILATGAVTVNKMGYDKTNNQGYNLGSEGLTAYEEYFVVRENDDPTKRYLDFYKTDSDVYNVYFVSENYVKNNDLMGENEAAQQEALMKLGTILGATSLATLKGTLPDFAIVKVEGGYKASYSFVTEDNAMANGQTTKNSAVVYFNDNYLTKVELSMTILMDLYEQGWPGAEEGVLSEMAVIGVVVDMNYGSFTASNMQGINNENFNVEAADYRPCQIGIYTADGVFIGNCNAKYRQTYADLSNIIFDNSGEPIEPVSLATYLETHTLYTDAACTQEFVYDASATIPDYDITLYEIAE